jgi:hypothetical protein
VSLGAAAPARGASDASVRILLRSCPANRPDQVGTTITIGATRRPAHCRPAAGRFTIRWRSGSTVARADRSGIVDVHLPAAAGAGPVRLVDRASGQRARFDLGPDHRATVVITRRLPPSVGGAIPPNPVPPHPAPPPPLRSSTPTPTPTVAGIEGSAAPSGAAAGVRAGGDIGTKDGPPAGVVAAIAAAGLLALALGGWFVVRRGTSRPGAVTRRRL